MAKQRMSAQLTRLARKRGRLPALVSATLIAAFIVMQTVLSSLAAWLVGGMNERVSFSTEPFLTLTLPFAVGVFLSLWLIAPLAAELTVAFVITRGLLASAAGTVLALLVSIVVDLVTLVGLGFSGRGFAHSVIVDLGRACELFIFTTPVVLLAAVLLLLWLREHPRDYEVAGLIDEL